MRLILQQEIADCGIACLGMVLSFYRSHIDLSCLRRRVNVSRRGTSMAELAVIGQAYAMRATVFYLRPSQLCTFRAPLILHWQGNHYVVLQKRHRTKGYYLLDPAAGAYWVSEDELLKQFSGFALLLEPGLHYAPKLERAPREYIRLLNSVPRLFILNVLIAAATLALHVLALLFPLNMQRYFNLGTYNHWQDLLIPVLLLLVVFKSTEIAIQVFRGLMINRLQNLLVSGISLSVLKHLLALPHGFFAAQAVEALYMRLHAIEKLRELLSRGLLEGLLDGLFALIIMLLICYTNPEAGIFILFLSMIYVITHFSLALKAQVYQHMQLSMANKSSTLILEGLSGIQSIKNFCRETEFIHRWHAQYQKSLQSGFKIASLQTLLDALRNVLFAFQLIILLLFNGLQERSSLGELYALVFYLNLLNKCIITFCNRSLDLRLMRLHLNHINEILLEPMESTASPVVIPAIREIRLQDISFQYHSREPWIMRKLHFTLQAGESAAIVGPSGCGKSTLLKLVMGTLTPSSGSILINDLPLPTVLPAYRRLWSAVMQEDELFNATIYENISLFAETVDPAFMRQCARVAAIDEEINKLPMGYHSYLGKNGVQLSSGQKQRILLARALYARPQILFLDEAFCHLDQQCESLLHERLQALGMIRVFITHRVQNLPVCDHIIDMTAIRC